MGKQRERKFLVVVACIIKEIEVLTIKFRSYTNVRLGKSIPELGVIKLFDLQQKT
jgi:hypothetical protein